MIGRMVLQAAGIVLAGVGIWVVAPVLLSLWNGEPVFRHGHVAPVPGIVRNLLALGLLMVAAGPGAILFRLGIRHR